MCLVLVGCPFTADAAQNDAQLVEARKIWDRAPHNAFTDLVRFKDRWFCVFREGQAHVSADGALRIITSKNGRDWTSTALIKRAEGDLRDAKIAFGALDQRSGGPIPAVLRGDDPQGAVGRHVSLAFAEHAKPTVLESDQVGECIMGRAVPDFARLDQLGVVLGG